MRKYFIKLRLLYSVFSFLFDHETWARLKPLKTLLRIIDPNNNKKIVDIGAGTGRLELALNRSDILIYDNDEASIRIAENFSQHVKVGSGLKIDFKDNSFDWVVCIHTLEHITEQERKDFIFELLRIAREGVYINFPEGEFAEKMCRNFIEAQKRNGQVLNKWTVEHLKMGLPMFEEIKTILDNHDKFSFRYKHIKNYQLENIYWSKMRTTNCRLISLIFSPWLSIFRYLFRDKLPSVELIVIGTKNETSSKEIIMKL